MDHVKYLGEGSHQLDRYGPIKINVIGRWSNIGLGDQILHGFTLVMFLNTIMEKFPNLFDIDHLGLYNLFGPLTHVDNITKMSDEFCKQFIPFDSNGRPINKPKRLYQLNVFKFFHEIRDAREILGAFPEHINLVTGKQKGMDMYQLYNNTWDISDPKLIMEIIRLSRSDEVKRNKGWVNIIMNCRILGTREKRREFSENYLNDLHPDFHLDSYSQRLLDEIHKLRKEGKCAGCIHYRLTDTTLVQRGDPDKNKNGKAVETCLGPQEPSGVFNQKVSKWINELRQKYRDKGGKMYIFTDDFPECRKRYSKHFQRFKSIGLEVEFVDQRSLRSMFTESWQDYMVMRECNEHCGAVSMFGLWVKSYGPFEEEIITQDRNVFSQNMMMDNMNIMRRRLEQNNSNQEWIADMLAKQNQPK